MAVLALLFLLFECFHGFYLLWKLDNGLYLQDIRLFYLSFYSVYCLSWPLVNYSFDIEPNNDAYIATLFSYGLALVPFNIILMKKKIRWKNNNSFEIVDVNTGLVLKGAIAMVGFAILFMKSAGVPMFQFGENMMERREYFSAVTQVWVVLNMIISAMLSLIAFNFSRMSKMNKMIFIGLVLFYILFQLSMGNRREFAPFLMFVLGYSLITKQSKVNVKVIGVLMFLFIGSFYVSMKRNSATRELAGSEAMQLALQSNEFVYPMQTTYYTIKGDWDFRFGTTYILMPIQTLIPRAIYPDKPASLGSEFVRKTFGDNYMAFAYTPVTEAYLNGGYIGIIIVFWIVSSFLNKLVRRANESISIWYLLLFSLCLDWARSDFSSIIYTVIIIYFSLKITYFFCKRKRIAY